MSHIKIKKIGTINRISSSIAKGVKKNLEDNYLVEVIEAYESDSGVDGTKEIYYDVVVYERIDRKKRWWMYL